MIKKAIYNVLVAMMLSMFSGCASEEDRRIEDTLTFAGDNRRELQKALDYYKDRGENLKWKAARFLIANMKDKFAYDGPELDSIRQDLMAVDAKKPVKRKWRAFSYKNLPKKYDAQVMTADFLIENIELAFQSWQQYEWGKHYSFEDFCEYLLPYRINDEPLESWRGEYRKRFIPLLDSLYRGTDVIEAASIMQNYAEHAGYRYNTDFTIPHQGACFLQKCWVGTCRDYCDYIIYIFRTLGIPVARERYKYSPEVRHGHEWNAVKDTTGRFIPIEFHDTMVQRDWENKRRKGKVYRSCFAEQEIPIYDGNYYEQDVTEEYFGANRVKAPIEEKENGFIAVFSFEGWMPIARYKHKGGYACVENIESETILMPVLQGKGGLVENGFPFMPDGNEVRVLVPDLTQREKVRLTRKYPVTMYVKDHLYRMNGARIEGSNRLNFKDADTLAVVQDSILELKRYVRVRPPRKCRYIKFTSFAKVQLEIAELSIYADTALQEKLNFEVIESVAPLTPGNSVVKVQDGDRLSFYRSRVRNASIVIDLGKPRNVGGFVCLPRNDDNYVKKGECYELLYQNGADGWKSLGRKVAEADFIDFDDVPANALLRLHNCTKGVEEQVFLWENGRQRFLGHLR